MNINMQTNPKQYPYKQRKHFNDSLSESLFLSLDRKAVRILLFACCVVAVFSPKFVAAFNIC